MLVVPGIGADNGRVVVGAGMWSVTTGANPLLPFGFAALLLVGATPGWAFGAGPRSPFARGAASGAGGGGTVVAVPRGHPAAPPPQHEDGRHDQGAAQPLPASPTRRHVRRGRHRPHPLRCPDSGSRWADLSGPRRCVRLRGGGAGHGSDQPAVLGLVDASRAVVGDALRGAGDERDVVRKGRVTHAEALRRDAAAPREAVEERRTVGPEDPALLLVLHHEHDHVRSGRRRRADGKRARDVAGRVAAPARGERHGENEGGDGRAEDLHPRPPRAQADRAALSSASRAALVGVHRQEGLDREVRRRDVERGSERGDDGEQLDLAERRSAA